MSGVYRVEEGGERELMLSGSGLVGLAFDPRGSLVVASSDTLYRVDVPLRAPDRP